jgi:hypothetical protein
MSNFIRVLGEDPYYSPRKTYMYLDPKAIYKAIPIYAVQDENGDYWRSIDTSDAYILSYLLIDMKGNQYTCADINELEKLGKGCQELEFY